MTLASPGGRVDGALSATTRAAVLEYVLERVHPRRREAEVVGVAPEGDGVVVGVKAHPCGYVSVAKYALVTVDGSGDVVDAEACTGVTLRRRLSDDGA
jgi:hypothetical protein